MHKLKCLLFDLDDTLLHSDPLRIWALKKAGHPNPSSISVLELRYKSPVQIMKPYGGICMNDYWKNFISHADKYGQLTSNKLPRIISKLRSSGIKLGLVTSSPESVAHRILEIANLIEYFETCLVGYQTCKRNKARGILTALHKLGARKEISGYVGDSINDYRASSAAGIDFYLSSWAHQGLNSELSQSAARVLSKAEDLLDFI
jgi:phosphoglycolate phosphatase-like HAD superfamily hydrolase